MSISSHSFYDSSLGQASIDKDGDISIEINTQYDSIYLTYEDSFALALQFEIITEKNQITRNEIMSTDKASDIIEMSCCGQGLPIGCNRFQLAARVRELEDRILVLNLEIIRIQTNVNNANKSIN